MTNPTALGNKRLSNVSHAPIIAKQIIQMTLFATYHVLRNVR